MQRFFLKKPQKLIGAISALLTVVFVGIVVGPVFLSAYNPVTAPASYDQAVQDFNKPEYQPQSYDEAVSNFNNPTPSEAQKGAAKLAADKAQQEDLAKKFTCLSWGGMNLNACMASLMDKVMWLSARTLWISGVLFNITVSTTLNFNDLLTRLPVVDIGWKVLRDLANIVFIFIALWAGISITLGIGDDGKKAWGLLAQMVLVALFINFSLFITKAVVDASNVASLHFYSLIVEPGHEKDYDKGLSEAFLYGLNLSTLYDSKKLGAGGTIGADQNLIAGATQGSGKELSFTNIILIGFFGSLFIIVTAWVFFAAAIMFIYRAVTLMMLMMLSPLAFVGFILPGASGMAHAWWSKLWSQAFFAPLYLALAYVVVRTINAQGFREGLSGLTTGDGMSFAAALTGTGPNTVAVIFNFIMLIGLMVGCLVVAQSLGAKGSDMAMAGWEKIKGAAVGTVGATVRGGIKAPSAILRGAGSMATGGATKAVGSWMATSRLLNNKMMQKIGVSGWASKKSQEYGEAAEKMRGSRFNQIINKVATKTGDALDIRHLEERAGQSTLGNTFAGKLLRSVTTGAVANASIGGKSLQEAYEQDEHNASRRHIIGFINQARVAGTKLGDLQHHGMDIQKAKSAAEQKVAEARKKVSDARQTPPPLTPEQQANVTKRERELEEAKQITPAEEGEITKIEASITTAEADLKTAQAQFEATGGTGPESDKLVAEIDVIEKEIKENKGKIDIIKNPARIAMAEMALAEAKRPPLTPEQENAKGDAIKSAEKTLASAETKLSEAEKLLKEFTESHGSEMSALEDAISHAWGQMTSKEAAELTPKDDLLNNPTMVDYQYMPTSHAIAIRDDEHALTETDKEEFFHNRTHRLSEIAKMVDQRNAQFRQDHLLRQQVLNKQTEELKKIAPELRKSLEHLTSELAEELKKLGKELKT